MCKLFDRVLIYFSKTVNIMFLSYMLCEVLTVNHNNPIQYFVHIKTMIVLAPKFDTNCSHLECKMNLLCMTCKHEINVI